jgi:hypothetical protein
MFILDENQGVGYLATDRFAPQGYVHIYSWAIPEQRQYCRGMAPDSLAAYAQLRAFYKAERLDYAPSELSELSEPSASHDAISFVINDSVIYTSVDDFLSQEAKSLFIEWEQFSSQLAALDIQLSTLRIQYAEADEKGRSQLAPQILQLEQQITDLKERCFSLPLTIRRLEILRHEKY